MPRASTDWLCVVQNRTLEDNLEENVTKFAENREVNFTEDDFISFEAENGSTAYTLIEDLEMSFQLPKVQLVSFNETIYVPQLLCPAYNDSYLISNNFHILTLQNNRHPRLIRNGMSSSAPKTKKRQKAICLKPGYWEVQDPCGLWRQIYLFYSSRSKNSFLGLGPQLKISDVTVRF